MAILGFWSALGGSFNPSPSIDSLTSHAIDDDRKIIAAPQQNLAAAFQAMSDLERDIEQVKAHLRHFHEQFIRAKAEQEREKDAQEQMASASMSYEVFPRVFYSHWRKSSLQSSEVQQKP
jgi:hypothetical protein